jgi:hypothetical protein
MSDAKILGALINGLARRQYHEDADMTDDFLAEQLFGGDAAGTFGSLSLCREVVRWAGDGMARWRGTVM